MRICNTDIDNHSSGRDNNIILILHPIVPELRQQINFKKSEVPSLMNFLENKKFIP